MKMEAFLQLVLRAAADEDCWPEIEKHFDLENFLAEECSEKVLQTVMGTVVWVKESQHLIPVILAKIRDPDALCLRMLRKEMDCEVMYDYAKMQLRNHMEVLNFSALSGHPDYPKTLAMLQRQAPELVPAAKGAE